MSEIENEFYDIFFGLMQTDYCPQSYGLGNVMQDDPICKEISCNECRKRAFLWGVRKALGIVPDCKNRSDCSHFCEEDCGGVDPDCPRYEKEEANNA